MNGFHTALRYYNNMHRSRATARSVFKNPSTTARPSYYSPCHHHHHHHHQAWHVWVLLYVWHMHPTRVWVLLHVWHMHPTRVYMPLTHLLLTTPL